jgi:hypothetical protein
VNKVLRDPIPALVDRAKNGLGARITLLGGLLLRGFNFPAHRNLRVSEGHDCGESPGSPRFD